MRKALTLAEVLAGRGTMLPVFSKAGFTLAEYDTYVAQNDDHLVILNSIQSLLRNRFRIFWLLRTCAYRLTQLASSLVRFVRSGMTINNNVILSRSEGSHNIEILRSLCSLRMTWGKGVNVFSLYKGEGNKNRNELINLSTYPLINFKPAFTLAEVLITLGIIGIVAALTIPELINKYKRQALETGFQRAHSTMLQAIKLWKEIEDEDIYSNYFDSSDKKGTELRSAFYKYLKGTPVPKNETLDENNLKLYYTSAKNSKTKAHSCPISCCEHPYKDAFITFDGIQYKICARGTRIYTSFDINGYHKGPNKWGVDLFNFYIDQENEVKSDHACIREYCSTYYHQRDTHVNDGMGCSFCAIKDKNYFKKIDL